MTNTNNQIINSDNSDNSDSTHLIVGLDLSLNSTGLTMITNTGIEFHRFVFDGDYMTHNKKGELITKKYVPKPIPNITQHVFTLPTNIQLTDIVDETDFYSEDQASLTLRTMVIVKRIIREIDRKINQRNINALYVNIEGFIQNNQNGANQLRVLGALIMLQGLVRSELIKLQIKYDFSNFKLFVTSPTNLKMFFTGKGSAEKEDMLDAFNNFYDGAKLLPDTTSLSKINDVIDSFALAINTYHRIYFNESFMELHANKVVDGVLFKKVKKVKKKKLDKSSILKDSIPK